MTIDECIKMIKDNVETEWDESTKEIWIQIAEWLEELKDYRDKNKMVVRIDVENLDRVIDRMKELEMASYYAGVDNLVDEVDVKISESHIWNLIVSKSTKDASDLVDKLVDYFMNTVKEIAEKLKGDVKNDD